MTRYLLDESLKQQWTTFKEDLLHCKLCTLRSSRFHTCLYRGALPCELLFIGEAPGETENVFGEAMIGPTRQVMDDILTAFPNSLGDCHYPKMPMPFHNGIPGYTPLIRYCIINTVQCHPSNNANPTDVQVRHCRPYVLKYIDLAKPKVIVLCGSVALQYLYAPICKHLHWLQSRSSTTRSTQLGSAVVHIPHPAAILRKHNKVFYDNAISRCVETIAKAYNRQRSKSS